MNNNIKRIISLTVIALILLLSAVPSFAGNGDGSGGGKDKPLTLVNSSVANGEENVAPDVKITLEFSKNVVHMTVRDNNMKCFKVLDSKGNKHPIAVDMGDDQVDPDIKRIVNIIPDKPYTGGETYTLVIGKDVTSKSGVSLGKDNYISFTIAKVETATTEKLPPSTTAAASKTAAVTVTTATTAAAANTTAASTANAAPVKIRKTTAANKTTAVTVTTTVTASVTAEETATAATERTRRASAVRTTKQQTSAKSKTAARTAEKTSRAQTTSEKTTTIPKSTSYTETAVSKTKAETVAVRQTVRTASDSAAQTVTETLAQTTVYTVTSAPLSSGQDLTADGETAEETHKPKARSIIILIIIAAGVLAAVILIIKNIMAKKGRQTQ
ncbi:MAG: Ig-like domain-containing protein [Clostridia bacterium]|nr:Ig-like domain-containing protein [Clostridia bacterium]